MGREQFQRALEDLRRETAAMAVQVESQINRALQVMQQPDSEVAVNIQAEDQAINEFCRRLREHGFQIIATQQPVAGDLRAIMGVSSIAIELERMGDYAVRLARRSGILAEPPQHPLPPHFARMGELATAMVHDILTALADQDARRAREIAVRDEEIDHLYREVVDYLIGRGKPSPYIALRTVTLIQAAHDLERISDRVTNIAEDIIFWVEGEIVEL